MLWRDAALARRLLQFQLMNQHLIGPDSLAVVRSMSDVANKMESVIDSSSQLLTSCVLYLALLCAVMSRGCVTCCRRTRSKFELKLRRTRERVIADVKSLTSEIESFKNKAEMVLMGSYCEQLTSMKATMESIDRCSHMSFVNPIVLQLNCARLQDCGGHSIGRGCPWLVSLRVPCHRYKQAID